MKLLQWNIWIKEDAKNVLQTLAEIDADILCLQELTINNPEYNLNLDVPQMIAEQTGFEYFFGPADEEVVDGVKQKYGNGIFSRFPITGTSSVFIQDPPEPGMKAATYADEGRIYIEADIDTPQGKLTVGTTHMSYTDRLLSTPAKDKEADRLFQALGGKRERFIFSGDLNALPDSYTITGIAKLLKDCGPSIDEKTWTTKPFSYNGFEANTLDWRIDYCFATPDIGIKSARTVQTTYSDHLPILIEI